MTLLLIIGTAAVLRLYQAYVAKYIWDEEMRWIPLAQSISLRPGHLHLPLHEGHDPSLPAYFIKASSILFGETPVGFRFPSLLAGMLTILFVYLIAREWRGARAGLWAGGLLAFNEYHIGISSFAVEKSYYLCFVSIAVYSFSRFLQTAKPNFLYLTAVATGLGFLCKLLATLLIPVFFITLLVSGSGSWLRRKEPYIALLIFLVLISPDIYWNVKNPDTTVPKLNYAGHLSRIGGIGFTPHYFLFGFTPHYFLFYGRDAIRGAYHLLRWQLKEYLPEYPSMNTLFGAILLVSVVLTTSHYKREGSVTRFLIVLFWFVLGFFVLIRPGDPSGGVDPVGFFWVDMSLLPAVVLTAGYFSQLKGRWRRVGYFAAAGAAVRAVLVIAAG